MREKAEYRPAWTQFMCFKLGIPHDRNATFSQDVTLSVVLEDICRHFNMLAYGKEEPEEADRPIFARASTLEYKKKAISSFSSRRLMQWDDVTQRGNPTRSVQVNDPINGVKKHEVRQEGVKSQARRELTFAELLSFLSYLRSRNLHGLVAVIVTQWQLIGRIDDMMKLKYANIKFKTQHSFTIFVKLRWSRNITEERDAPDQILLGSMDERICVLLNLALHIESQPESSTALRQLDSFVFGSSGGERAMRSALAKAFGADGFEKTDDGPVGTHSIRKGAATYGSTCGLSKDYVERRGRWRNDRGVVNRYISTTLPYPDAVVAGVLAGPAGPARYVRKNDSPFVTETFLIESVAPGIARILGRHISAILALPILWAVLEPSLKKEIVIPVGLKTRIISAVVAAGGDIAKNPVERVPIHVGGGGGMVSFTDLGCDTPLTPHTPASASATQATPTRTTNCAPSETNATMRELQAVHANIGSLKRRLEELEGDRANEIARLRSDMKSGFEMINKNVKRIALQPVVRAAVAQGDVASTEGQRRAPRLKLPKCPRDLYVLWHEYEFGRDGIKPAKLMTSVERGQNKSTFSRRKIFWDTIVNMVRRGHTSDAAIDKVYSVYGRSLCVTDILKGMRSDRQRGGHPELN